MSEELSGPGDQSSTEIGTQTNMFEVHLSNGSTHYVPESAITTDEHGNLTGADLSGIANVEPGVVLEWGDYSASASEGGD